MHLFELEDQAWWPQSLRDAMTDFLSFTALRAGWIYAPFVDKLARAMQRCGVSRLVDLCTGGCGPAAVFARLLMERGVVLDEVLLTDLFPNVARMERTAGSTKAKLTVVKMPVDATAVPIELSGFRTLCNGFHHLSPDAARRCLQDAVTKRQGIAVIELVERSSRGFFQVASAILLMLVATPLILPFRWSRLFYTYCVPVIPLATLWDGMVSCLRVYSPKELGDLVAQLPQNDYEWDIGRIPVRGTPVRITYLIGTAPATLGR